MRETIQKAIKLHQSGNLSTAKKIYAEVLEQDANNEEVLHLAGILAAQEKDFPLAKNFLMRALILNPNSATLNNSMGNIYKNLNEFNAAKEFYEKALKAQPYSAVAHNNLGNVYYKLNQIGKAEQEYRQAIELKPDYIEPNFNLSLILIRLNKTEKAINILLDIIKLEPNHAEALLQLALLFHQQNKSTEAIKHYQQALRANNGNAVTHNNLGSLLLNFRNRQNQAIRHFKMAIKLDSNNLEAYHNLGAAFLMQEKPEAALKYFLHLLQFSQNFDTYYNLGVIYMDIGRGNDAVEYFNEALKMNPSDMATRTNLAAIYLKQENVPEAINHYESILKLQPQNKEVKYILTALRQKTTDPELKTAPPEYVEHLFNQYAKTFDKHLQLLKYKAPDVISEAIKKLLPDITTHSLKILDLGCGTGLCGENLKSLAKQLIGIDLSKNMLEIAKSKNIYDELLLGNIENLITDLSNIDLIVAADTFGYVGDLVKIFSSCHNALTPNGVAIFTVEKTNIYPYTLQQNARFAHSQSYIEELVNKYNFKLLSCDDIVIRNQRNLPVSCNLYIVQK